jgi:hypothetical protein
VSHDEAEFAVFFEASWDPCLRAVAASTGAMLLAEDQMAGDRRQHRNRIQLR